ncbi:MAG: glycosyltransferase family 39 protein [Proteobacteria bacterium]|nr:glycosyltransferase family 39 protein [Pseudomonadota bacterium]
MEQNIIDVRHWNWVVLASGVLVVLLCSVRLIGLEKWPAGFYVDEAGEAGNVLCISETGESYTHEPMPLYATGPAGGKLSPIFVYGASVWTQIFGPSISSFRAMTGAWNILGLVGLFFLGRFFGGPKAGTLTLLVGALCPWAIMSARVAWDPALTATPVIWGTYFLIRAQRTREFALAGIVLAFATYCYQAQRIQVPLLSGAILFLRWRSGSLSWRKALIFMGTALVVATPQLAFVLTPGGYERAARTSIMSEHYRTYFADNNYWTLLGIFLKNIYQHLSPSFLFLAGDRNLRHSIPGHGQLGLLDLLGLTAAITVLIKRLYIKLREKISFSRSKLLGSELTSGLAVQVSMIGIFCGVIPAALTWEGIPHALRSVGSWPFFALLSGTTLSFWLTNKPRFTGVLVALVTCISIWQYVSNWNKVKKLSEPWFDHHITMQVEQLTTESDWLSFAIANRGVYSKDALTYHFIAKGGYTCSIARTMIESIK